MSEVQIAVISAKNTELTLAVPGHQGAGGAAGVGVPTGGTTGQILEKVSNTDYDTQWADAPIGNITGVTAGTGLSGGGTSGNVTLNLNASIDALTDVDTTTTPPTNGQALAWDNANSEWIPMDMAGTANLGYTSGASSGEVTSSTGTNATIPGFTSTNAGLAGASGGGTTNFLRADGTWTNPPGTTDLTYATAATTGTINSSTGTDATIPKFTSTDAGLVHGSGGGTANFLRADGTWNIPPGSTNLSYTASATDGTVNSDTGTDATVPVFDSTNAGLVGGSGGGTTNFLRADGTWHAPPGVMAGADTQVQFNDNGGAGGDTGLTFNKTTNELTVGVSNADPGTATVKGDLNLDSGGNFSTTIQSVTPTANRTISFPDQTGTVGLVSGATGNIQYNSSGALAGTADLNVSLDWTNAAIAYTGLKVNVTDTASAAGSKLFDLQSNGTSQVSVDSSGSLEVASELVNSITVGRGAGAISTNTAVGSYALRANTTGNSNTANGFTALYSNTTGNSNTANGLQALYSNTAGINNTANGVNALYSNTTGVNNTANGLEALFNNTTGNRNTANGLQALYSNTTGAGNTANGVSALFNNTTGAGNICLGSLNSAGAYAPVFDCTTENNRVVVGSTAVTNAYIQVAWTVVSDERDKTNFDLVPHGLDFVKQLNPVAFQFKEDRDTDIPHGPVRYGFKAQDILALEGDDNAVIIDNENPDKLRYNGEALVPVLVNAIKELAAENAALKARLDAAGI